jgi:hypothetical protein
MKVTIDGKSVDVRARWVGIIDLTPELAAELKRFNTKNRNLNAHHVNLLKRKIESGSFIFNGVPICINTVGEMTEGQHRCEAVILSGKTVVTTLVLGVDGGSLITKVDELSTSAGQILGTMGCADSMAIARCLFIVTRQCPHGPSLAVEELMEAYEKHPEIRQSLSFVRSLGKPLEIVPRTFAAAFHYITSQKHKHRADQFMAYLLSEEPSGRTQAVQLLRQRLLANKMSGRATAKLHSSVIWALMVKAWNHGDSTMKQLSWKPGEEMPTLA